MTPVEATDAVLDQAEVALERGLAADALRLSQSILAEDPMHGGALFVRGDALLMLGDLARAAESFHRAAHVHPNHAASWSSHARVSAELLRTDAAASSVSRALKADPTCAEAWWVRSLLAEWAGDTAQVKRARSEAARLDPIGFPLPPELSDSEIELLVEEAIESLHPAIQQDLANVAILLEDLPSRETLESLEEPTGAFGLLGLFTGPSLRERNHEDPWSLLPPTVTLYRRNLERRCRDRAELVEQLEITLYHEIGHFLGLDEEDLLERGLD